MRYVVALLLTVSVVVGLHAQESGLVLDPEDLRIEQTIEGGYYLYIRATGAFKSVLLTESTEDPQRRVATYAFRNPEYHPTNGEEKRILDGAFLDREGLYFLVDSTPEPDTAFGAAFRIFVPYIVEFGYDWTRNGELMVLDGTYFSVRTFELPFADYSGAFQDNPFTVRVTQRVRELPPPPPEPEPEPQPEPEPERPVGNFMEDTVEEFSDIAEAGDGTTRFSAGPEDTVSQIRELLPEPDGQSLDLVIALDTTKSMQDDIPMLRRDLVPMIQEIVAGFSEIRIGFMLYRDYMEDYLVRRLPLEANLGRVQQVIDSVRVAGGRDIPEAVYEALWASLETFAWQAEERMIVLVGDAPPHPRPRGSVTPEQVFASARERDVIIHTIILPQ